MALLDWYEKLEQDATRLAADLADAPLNGELEPGWSAASSSARATQQAIRQLLAVLRQDAGRT